MRNMKSVLSVAGLSLFTCAGAFAAAGGTDILHFSVRETMTNEGIEANAGGSVNAARNQQGNADNQKLTVAVNGLTASSSYGLFAVTADGPDLVEVTNFTTDASGAAALQYQSKGNGNGNGNGNGKKPGLPGALNPLSDIRWLGIGTITTVSNLSTTNIVLNADLTDPDKLQYLIKRNLSENGVEAALRIKATTSETQFRLNAQWLAPTSDYLLVLNDEIVATHTSDATGQLAITDAPTPAQILDLHSVALWDASSNVVVSTTLP